MRLNEQSRGCIRSILVTIIIGTIPFYILAIIVWVVPRAEAPNATDQPPLENTDESGAGDPGDPNERPTWTPINPDELVTLRPVTGTVELVTSAPTSGLISPAPTIVIFTSTPTPEFIPIVPTSAPLQPTATLTRTPSRTPTATNTIPPAPTNTVPPAPTQPPLLPPTDTPAP